MADIRLTKWVRRALALHGEKYLSLQFLIRSLFSAVIGSSDRESELLK